MSDLSAIPTLPDNENAEPGHRSPWGVLAAMIVLIVALLSTSATMLYFVWKKGEETAGSSLHLSSLMEHGKGYASTLHVAKTPPATAQVEHENLTEPAPPPKSGRKGNIKWPRLKLTGFGSSSDGTDGFAIINGNQVFLNQSMGKVRLIAVHAHDVVVECQGEQKTLTTEFEH